MIHGQICPTMKRLKGTYLSYCCAALLAASAFDLFCDENTCQGDASLPSRESGFYLVGLPEISTLACLTALVTMLRLEES